MVKSKSKIRWTFLLPFWGRWLLLCIHQVIHGCLVAKYFAEATHIFARPAGIHFAIFAKFAVHQIVRTFNANNLVTVRLQLYKYIAGYVLLGALQKSFYIAHYRVQNLPFVQPVAIKSGNGIFPAQLPFGKHVLFQRMMRFNNHHRRCCFKAHTTFDANDGIAHMNIPANAISARLYFVNTVLLRLDAGKFYH